MSATVPPATDAGAKGVLPEFLAAWPRSSQYALAFLIVLALSLMTLHVVLGRLTDARPTTLTTEKVLTQAVDLNQADRVQLRQIPELGDSLAQAIIEYRRSRGGFASVDELANVPGVGPQRLARFRAWVYVANEEPSEEEKPVAAPAKKKPASNAPRGRKGDGLKGPLDLNTATEEELKQLEGLGPVLARRIVEARAKRPFTAVEDLLKIPFLKQKTLDKVRPFVMVKPQVARDE